MHTIGWDLHQRESQLCILDAAGAVVREQRIATRVTRFAAAVSPLVPCRILLEASTESQWVATALAALGAEVIVADPRFGAMYATRSRRVKTDQRDARALAEACYRGTYHHAHQLSAEQRAVREQLAVRGALVRTRARYIVQLRTLVRSRGLRVPTGTASHFLARLQTLTLPADLAAPVAPLCALLPVLSTQIHLLDQQLTSVANASVLRLQTLPGIGPITALAFVATLDDAARFLNTEQVAAYCGLVPSEYSSGEHQRRGRITKAGNTHLRSLLVEAAWSVMRTKRADAEPLRAWATRLTLRRGKSIAMVALARRLAGIAWRCWRDETDYNGTRLGAH